MLKPDLAGAMKLKQVDVKGKRNVSRGAQLVFNVRDCVCMKAERGKPASMEEKIVFQVVVV